MSKTANRGFRKVDTTSPDYTPVEAARAADIDIIDTALGVKVFDGSAGHVAIDIKEGTALLTKTGSGGSYTLAKPVAGLPSASTPGDDGKILRVVSTTAQAHTLTNSDPGFNAGGSAKDVGTFGGAVGDSVELLAYNAEWIVINSVNVTLG